MAGPLWDHFWTPPGEVAPGGGIPDVAQAIISDWIVLASLFHFCQVPK